jgi:hypothetical protein
MARIEVAIGAIALALTNINDVAIMSRQDVDVIIERLRRQLAPQSRCVSANGF